jgi:hypothetical protein
LRIAVGVLALSLIGCNLATPTPSRTTSPGPPPTPADSAIPTPGMSPTATAVATTSSVPTTPTTPTASPSASPPLDPDLQAFIDLMAVLVHVGDPVWLDGNPYYGLSLARPGSLVTLAPARAGHQPRGIAEDGLVTWWRPDGAESVVEVLDARTLAVLGSFRWQHLDADGVARPIPNTDDVLVSARGIWRVDLPTGAGELIDPSAPWSSGGVDVSDSGRTWAWSTGEYDGVEARVAVDGEVVARVPGFVVSAVSDAFVLGYEFVDVKSSGRWAVYDLATGQIRHSRGQRNWAWTGYSISQSEFLVTESGEGFGPRLVIYDGATMNRRVVRADLGVYEHLQYFNRSDRWAVMATSDFIRYHGYIRSVRMIDLETGETVAHYVFDRVP